MLRRDGPWDPQEMWAGGRKTAADALLRLGGWVSGAVAEVWFPTDFLKMTI